MKNVPLNLPESEAKILYRHLHQWPSAQDLYCETYRQLQVYFFQTLTVVEVTTLLDGKE